MTATLLIYGIPVVLAILFPWSLTRLFPNLRWVWYLFGGVVAPVLISLTYLSLLNIVVAIALTDGLWLGHDATTFAAAAWSAVLVCAAISVIACLFFRASRARARAK